MLRYVKIFVPRIIGRNRHMKQTLTPSEEAEARALFNEFWRRYPNQRNPTDINTPEKATFLKSKGFDRIRLMQRARKQAYDFTTR